jgi:nitronate monooxygenase
MSMPALFKGRLSIPVIGAPLFIISVPDLVIAQCKAGIVGSFPALNARPPALLDEWLVRIGEELASYDKAHPERPSAPFAVNQIVHRSNNRLDQDLALCEKHKVPMIITSLGAREELNQAAHRWGGIVFHDVINQKFAHKAIEKGADGLILVSAGAGGHAGEISPFAFVANGSTDRLRCRARSATAAQSARYACSAPTSPISARPSSPPPKPTRWRATSR